jgi:hypothetical protein
VKRDGEPSEPPGSGATDEVRVPVGPDRDNLGLFDWQTSEGTVTGERTAGPPGGADAPQGDQRRTAVLAWIAAHTHPEPSTPAATGPCEPLKRLIADEPLDPLPALDGVPRPRARPAPQEPLAPEREDTATQIQGFEAALPPEPEVAPPTPPPVPAPATPSPRTLLLLALAATIVAALLRLLG